MTEKSKILFVVTQSEWGGAQRYIFDLATNLPPENYEIFVAAGVDNDNRENLLTKLDEKNIKSYSLKNLVREINPWQDLKAYFEIKKLIKTIRPDIIHLNSSKAGVIGAIAGRHAKIKKIIYTVHGFVFNEPLPRWKRSVYLWAEKFSAKLKNKIICVSDFDRQTGIANKIAKAEKFFTIHNGIGEINFLSREEARKNLFSGKDYRLQDTRLADATAQRASYKLVGTIANFYPTKNLKSLIQAASIVTKKYPETIFAIIGDGQLRSGLETEINNLKLNNKVVLLGEKPRASSQLLAFDIYVCSSVKEGLPYSIMEAMRAGLPIVSTNVGGIPEMIIDQQSGLLVKSNDSDELAKAIINILENDLLSQKLSQQAKIDATKNFDLDKMITQTQEVYAE